MVIFLAQLILRDFFFTLHPVVEPMSPFALIAWRDNFLFLGKTNRDQSQSENSKPRKKKSLNDVVYSSKMM
jgi:hypothetical protein